VDVGEVCDLGDLDGDGIPDSSSECDIDCTAPRCGDGVVNPHVNDATPDETDGEECDPGSDEAGNPRSTATCNASCTVPRCGDGFANLAAGEECDEGGSTPTCDADCTLPVCGDGFFNASVEECDPGDGGAGTGVPVDTATCDSDCTIPICGDGHVNSAFVNPITGRAEECDDAGNSASCNADCTFTECGDGKHNPAAGEECDDGASNDNRGDCVLTCKRASCGDGFVHDRGSGTEQCDPGAPGMDTATCDHDCTFPVCGDGIINGEAGEQCDPAATEDRCPNPNFICCPIACTCELSGSCTL
jgi:hypothetical protein